MAQVYDRTWQFSNNNAYTASNTADSNNYMLWSLCSGLTGGTFGGLASGLWTVKGSSNGVAAGMDSVDRWHLAGAYTPGDLVHAIPPAAHSWMVLQSPTMNGFTFYMLISCTTASAYQITTLLAKVAFTGGSTTADPTSTDSWFFGTGANVNWSNGFSGAGYYNLCLSTTGDFIWHCSKSGASPGPQWTLMFVAPVGCHALDAYPVFNAAGTRIDGSILFQNTTKPSRLATGAAGYTGAVYDQNGAASLAAAAMTDSLSGARVDLPLWIAAYSTNGGWHRRGRLPDILFTMSNNGAATPGLTVRDGGGAIRYQTHGDLLIPANAAGIFT
jgi:hypothetical protein